MYTITDWDYLCAAVLGEFEVNGHRRRMCELLQLRQVGTVEDYRKQFDPLMYELLLYEPPSKIFFVTQFILGLKHELRAYVEPHMPPHREYDHAIHLLPDAAPLFLA